MPKKKKKPRNEKFCNLGIGSVQIRGWQKKCGACQHGVFVAIRGINKSGQFVCLPKAHLFKCPHASCEVGNDDFIESSIPIEVDLLNDNILDWQGLNGQEIDGLEQGVECAIIPRDQWFEILRIPVLKAKPCPQCQSPPNK